MRTIVMANPPFNNARGAAALTRMPPFDFDGVVMRVFPLRANIRALRKFCDRFLNLMPPEIAVFRPAVPTVFLAAINYGRMMTETADLGWVAQNEFTFNVLLNWYRREGGRLVFQDWASVSPFIFVDQESSMATGREVYGWPKTMAWLPPGISEWARNPRQTQNLFVLSSMVFPELFAGKRQEPRVLFEIQHEPAPELSQLAVDPFSRLNPMRAWPRALAQGLAFAGDLFQALARLPLAGYGTDPEWQVLPGLVARSLDYLNVFTRLPSFNTINLKQFRDSRDAAAACYQAITSSPMKVTRFNDGGLLGEPHQLTADASGGHRIRIHRYPAQPIVESLGLEIDEEASEQDHEVATLRPTFPFWVDVDMNYGRGRLVCWRTSEIDWRPGTTAARRRALRPAPERQAGTRAKHPYNTALGGAVQAVTGPFRFPNVTQRVLPLLADWFRLRRFCADYLDNDFTFFEPWGSYVYLIVTTFEEMSSETYNVGWWANRQVAFSFPVKWFKRGPGAQAGKPPQAAAGQLLGTALLTPFIYTDSDLGANTGREVQGLPMVKAVIESPESSWLEDLGPARRSELLRLRAQVFSGLGASQEIQERLLLEITRRDVLPATDEARWKTVAATWGERLYAEMYRRWAVRSGRPDRFEAARALALELVRGDGQPLNEISLRQFRDVERPERACYQALTLTRTTIEEVFELCEIEEPMHVALHRYPTQPVVETLGLRSKRTDAAGSSVVDYLQPIRPFWTRLALRVDLGEDLFWRADSEEWMPGTDDWRQPLDALRQMGPDQAAWRAGRTNPRNFYLVSQRPSVGPDVVHAIDADDDSKADLRVAWRFWRFEPSFAGDSLLSTDEARAAVGEESHDAATLGTAPLEVEPQMILESMLGNEWGRRHQPRGRSARLPEICVRGDTLGHEDVRRRFERKFGFEVRDGYWYLPRWESELAGADPAGGGGSEEGPAEE